MITEPFARIHAPDPKEFGLESNLASSANPRSGPRGGRVDGAHGPTGAAQDAVQFVSYGNDRDWADSTRMPLMSGDSGAATLPAPDGSSVADLMDLLKRAGGSVQRRQDVVPLVMPDGRRALLPIENVELEVPPVRRPAY
jgi:hypothetical protein